MASKLRKAIYRIGKIGVHFSKLFSYIDYLNSVLYSGYISAKLKHCGDGLTVIPKFLLLRGANYMSFGNNCWIGKGVQLLATAKTKRGEVFNPKIIVGTNCSIGDYSHITAIDMIKFGNNVRLGKNVLITDNAHGGSSIEERSIAPNERPLVSKGPVVIEDNVWIGEKASIMPNVHIGEGAIVGAGSVVTKDVEPYDIVAGNPARSIRKK